MNDLNIPLQDTKNVISEKEELNTSQKKNNSFILKLFDSKNSNKKFICENCNKLFSSKGNLKNHILKIHYNNRPFKCTFPNCTKAYSVETKLLAHERTHTGFKPFICQICQRSFNEKGNLKAHLKYHSEIRPFKCPLCEKSYKSNKHLKDHIKIEHYKIKNYHCEFCNKNFGRITTLKTHIKTHTKEKIFKCEFEGCGKCFSLKANMKKHYANHFKNLNQKMENEKEKKTYGPRKVEKDFEEKIKIALSQLDYLDNEQIEIEEKNENKINISSFDKKENLTQDNSDNIKFKDDNNLSDVNNSNSENFMNLLNNFAMTINSIKNDRKNLNNMIEKNDEKCLKDERIRYNNFFNINNINNSNSKNNFIHYNNLDLFTHQNLSSFDFNNNDLVTEFIDSGLNNKNLNEYNDELMSFQRDCL